MEVAQIISALAERSDDDEATEQENGCTADKAFKILNSDNVLKKIGDFGNQPDLYKLRQVNEGFYEMLNPTFFNIVTPCVCFSNIPINIFANLANNEEEIFFSPEEVSQWRAETFQEENSNSAPVIEIPLDQLPAYKHIFRAIALLNFKYDLELMEVFSQFHPYITMIALIASPFPESEEWTLLKFINQFTSLRDFNLLYALPEVSTDNIKVISSDELETLSDNLTAKPKITIYLATQHEEIVEKLGAKPNMNFEIAFLESNYDSLAVLQKFTNVLTRFNYLTNLKFDCTNIQKFYLNESRINNIADLKTLTTLWTQHCGGDEKNIHLKLELGIELTPHNFLDENEVKECLQQLSPYISRLTISQTFLGNKKAVVNMNCDWPKLVELEINGYKHPLEILKNCPKLKMLRILNLDYQSSIFHNNDQSMEQSLLEYFGNLSQLECLTLSSSSPVHVFNDTSESVAEKNIIKINGLDDYFKGLFPKLTYYKNLTSII